jgi:hypothetical protein
MIRATGSAAMIQHVNQHGPSFLIQMLPLQTQLRQLKNQALAD